MALTDDVNTTMLVQPSGGINYGNMGGGIFGNDGLWLLLVLLLGGGWGGFGGFGMDMGFGLYPWLNNSQNINDGFRDQQLATQINGIQSGVQGLSTQLCNCCADMRVDTLNGFNGVNNSIFGAQSAITAQLNANELASLNRSFAEQSANQQGFNGVQSGIADLRYTTAKESCDTRTQAAMNTRDIIDAIKGGDQMIYDKLCALELDGVKTQLAQAQRENVGLQNQVNMATARAENLANADNIVNSLYSRLSSCPTPSIPVAGNTPLFSCNPSFNSPNTGCGCNGGF